MTTSLLQLAVPTTAVVASLALAFRARGQRGLSLGFWGSASVGTMLAVAHEPVGHILVAVAVGMLVAARGRGAGWVPGLDVACLASSAVAVVLVGLAATPELHLLHTVALLVTLAAVGALAMSPGTRGTVLWILVTGLMLVTVPHVVVLLHGQMQGSLPAAIESGGHLALAVAALLPASRRLTAASACEYRPLGIRGIVLQALAVTCVLGAYVVSEWRTGGIDAPLFALTLVAVGCLVLLRTAIVGRLREDEHLQHERTAQRFRAIVEHGSDVTCVVDDAGSITYASPAVLRVFGHRVERVVGSTWRDAVHLSDMRRVEKACVDVRKATGRQARAEIRVREFAGGWRWVEVTMTNRLHDPAVEGLVCNLRDINDHKQAQKRLRVQATHDALTGLPNRTLLFDRLAAALDHGGRDSVAVAFLDLDHFKEINDTLGHDVGDRLLTAISARIREAVRPGDVVARFGGDEFVVVCEQLASRSDAIAIVERLQRHTSDPVSIAGQELHVTPSVGVAFATGNDDTPESLVRDADAAMYRAKEAGRARYAVFDETVETTDSPAGPATGAGLRSALRRDQFRVYYQPILDVTSGRTASLEALVRWNHPVHGILSPGQFLELADQQGLTSSIGQRVLSIAAADMRLWDGITGDRALGLSVNISAHQLRDETFVRDVERALAESGLEAGRLCLEVTENVFVEHGEGVAETMARLQDLGVRIGIDDFGAGYTSLSYLKRFPVDIMKIDPSYIAGICDNSADAAIVSAVIDLAHTFGAHTVAEGVETPAQLARLAELGCDFAQGFLFAHPQPAHAVRDLLTAQEASQTLRSS